MKKYPRILFAAPKSGSGKTMITCGVLALLQKRGLRAAAFKCGPDYIDPMFHRSVLEIPSGNLDTFFTDGATTRYLLQRKADNADITVLEGVMGYYDGLGGTSEKGSSYEVAKETGTPVILVVDAKGASVSLAAMIRGMLEYRQDSNIRGVILNRASAGYYERLKSLIEKECKVPVVGYVPVFNELSVPSRHLGLLMPEELSDCRAWVEGLAKALEKTLDVELILKLAAQADSLMGNAPMLPYPALPVHLAVAKDEAFSFYYEENIELLCRLGATISYFSPLHDKELPPDVDGLILGGGYPENYAEELSKAGEMKAAIRNACEQGMPCLAECGGFLYLQESLEGADLKTYPMAGVLSGKGYKTEKLTRFGYVELTGLCGGVLGEAGETIKGHEFHYWDCTENGEAFRAKKPLSEAGKGEYSCMIHTSRMAAGFPHLYYYSNPKMIYSFLECCAAFGARRRAKKHWDSIAKPIDSLGQLEEMVVKTCGISGKEFPQNTDKKALLIFCADHGVVKEGVSQTGSGVTRIVSENFAKGSSTVNQMARLAGAEVYTIDIGMDTERYQEKKLVPQAVIDCKIARGSGNLAVEPAMSLGQCKKALQIGTELVRELKEAGVGMIATGEMGIGNTTPTSVLAALFLKLTAKEVTGRGAGLSPEALERKIKVVAWAIERVEGLGLTEPVELLAQAGGYEIAGMAGAFLGGVRYKVPIVIDGAISAVAALVASKIDKRVPDYALASHESKEGVGKLALEALGLKAPVHAGMCLGEGTGAMTLFPLFDMALEVYKNMGTFEEYSIVPYERYSQ